MVDDMSLKDGETWTPSRTGDKGIEGAKGPIDTDFGYSCKKAGHIQTGVLLDVDFGMFSSLR